MRRIFWLIGPLFALCLGLAACGGNGEGALVLTEGEGAVLTVSIPRALRDTTIAVDTSGGSAFAHYFGSGQDFAVEGHEPDAGGLFLLPVKKGATKLKLNIKTLDDDVFETDETAALRFSGDPADFAADPAAEKTFVIRDNDTEKIVDIKADFGAAGDGKTDDTAALQAAVDAVAESGGGVVFVPRGEYLISSVMVTKGMTIMGEEGALIKRPAMQDKWCRTFSLHHIGDEDSAPFVVRDMTIDGNSQNQGAYKQYELEQAHLLFFYGVTEGGAQEAARGRIRGAAENLTLQNCVGDGISVYSNADVGVYNITAVDVFRGGLVITGGNSAVRASTIVTRSGEMGDPGGIDVEVDGEGFGGSTHVEIEVHRFHAEDGDFDVILPDGGVAVFYDCTAGRPVVDLGGDIVGELTFNRCRFVMGIGESRWMQFYMPNEITFNDCEFVASCYYAPDTSEGPDAAMQVTVSPISKIQWLGVSGKNPESRLVLNRCTFTVDKSVSDYPDYLKPVAIYINSSTGDNCKVILNDCEISDEYALGLYAGRPAYLELNNLANNAREAEDLHPGSTVVRR